MAFRFSQPRPANWQKLGGLGWHLDGLDEGKYHPFSLLIGVALNDQTNEFCGNLALHPGSHYTLKDYVKSYAQQCPQNPSDNEDYPEVYVPKPDLGINAASISYF